VQSFARMTAKQENQREQENQRKSKGHRHKASVGKRARASPGQSMSPSPQPSLTRKSLSPIPSPGLAHEDTNERGSKRSRQTIGNANHKPENIHTPIPSPLSTRSETSPKSGEPRTPQPQHISKKSRTVDSAKHADRVRSQTAEPDG
jgi:hypothetical protein